MLPEGIGHRRGYGFAEFKGQIARVRKHPSPPPGRDTAKVGGVGGPIKIKWVPSPELLLKFQLQRKPPLKLSLHLPSPFVENLPFFPLCTKLFRID